MRLNQKIQISYSTLFSHLFCVYLTLAGFGQPVRSAAVSSATPSPSPSVTAVPYVRKSRDISGLSATSAPESIDNQEQFVGLAGSSSNPGGRFFPYPSFKHKYQTRMARFHDERPATRTYSIRSMTSFPKLNPLAGILSLKSGETRHPSLDELENEEQDPTFTPFIGARALTNIPQFFQHLRSNLEALQLDDDDEESEESDLVKNEKLQQLGQSGDGAYMYGTEDEGKIPHIPYLPENKPMRWMPPTAGMTGRAHIRHFINDPVEQELFYRKPLVNPARNVYEFGLG